MQNLGTPTTLVTQKESLPLTFRLGVSYSPIELLSLVADEEKVWGEKSFNTYFGLDIKPIKFISLRVGGNFVDGNFAFTTGAGGVIFLNSFNLFLDYSLRPFDSAFLTHQISLSLSF